MTPSPRWSGKPQQRAAARSDTSLAERPERQAAVEGSRCLAPSKQRVAGSSPVGGIVRRPLGKRNVCRRSSRRGGGTRCCGSEALEPHTTRAASVCHLTGVPSSAHPHRTVDVTRPVPAIARAVHVWAGAYAGRVASDAPTGVAVHIRRPVVFGDRRSRGDHDGKPRSQTVGQVRPAVDRAADPLARKASCLLPSGTFV